MLLLLLWRLLFDSYCFWLVLGEAPVQLLLVLVNLPGLGLDEVTDGVEVEGIVLEDDACGQLSRVGEGVGTFPPPHLISSPVLASSPFLTKTSPSSLPVSTLW